MHLDSNTLIASGFLIGHFAGYPKGSHEWASLNVFHHHMGTGLQSQQHLQKAQGKPFIGLHFRGAHNFLNLQKGPVWLLRGLEEKMKARQALVGHGRLSGSCKDNREKAVPGFQLPGGPQLCIYG
jgi:hypothetical protein